MNWIRLSGLSPYTTAALVAHQIALVLFALCGMKFTPILALTAAAAAAYWHWNYADWTTSLTPGKSKSTEQSERQRWTSGFIFSMPLLFFAAPFNVQRLEQPLSLWWVMNALSLAAIFSVCILYFFKHHRIS